MPHPGMSLSANRTGAHPQKQQAHGQPWACLRLGIH
jgi:hypothetical protein